MAAAAIRHLAWKHGATIMLVHSRTNPESKGFWASMGFKPASRFTAQLVDVDGGDWGWSDTHLMELNVEHMAHISDTLLKAVSSALTALLQPNCGGCWQSEEIHALFHNAANVKRRVSAGLQ